ncbi:MAG: 2-amino-4-hydroxy-6-hydroxymethyldihydropteridine diphosphokinase [Porticoccaceae bacterium]
MKAYIGLGSNLDNPRRQIAWALDALARLPESRLDATAPLYRSRALGPGTQPDYLNTVVRLRTVLAPHRLLRELLALETARGRRRDQHWGPRTLDLDILLYDEVCLADAELTIPHPRLAERNFVLIPLHDLDPDLILPDGTALAELLARIGRAGIVRL